MRCHSYLLGAQERIGIGCYCYPEIKDDLDRVLDPVDNRQQGNDDDVEGITQIVQ